MKMCDHSLACSYREILGLYIYEDIYDEHPDLCKRALEMHTPKYLDGIAWDSSPSRRNIYGRTEQLERANCD